MSGENQISAALFAARTELNELQRETVALASSLSDPDDPQWIAADRRIEETQARIRRLEALKNAGAVYQAEAAVVQLQAKRQAAFDKAMEIARNRVKLAAKIDKTVATLGELLGEWDSAGIECQDNAGFLHAGDNYPGYIYSLMSAARGGSARFAAALEWQLFRAGVGRVGIPLDSAPRRQLGEPYSMTDAAEYVVNQLDAQLTRALEHMKVA